MKVGHFQSPVYVTSTPSEPGKLYVVEQAGRIMVRGSTTPFLDIRSLVKSGGELGLLSMAFDPNYAKNHRFYVDYTDQNGDTRVVRYASNGTTGNPRTAKQLLFVKDFASNHNGGQLQFGPDGRLYWGNGDGGDAGDPKDNGQNLNRPFSKIMRLNVNVANARWQLVAYGLRNPWRFSFDRANGDLYIGDVGQDHYEEIDYLRHGFAGRRELRLEALRGQARLRRRYASAHRGPVRAADGRVSAPGGLLGLRRLRLPRDAGPARGRAATSTATTARATIWSLRVVNGRATSVRREAFTVPGLSGFGEDTAGELYLTSVNSGDLFRLKN